MFSAIVDSGVAGRAGGYAVESRARIDEFVLRNFTWPGTFRLHREALGLDILRAPANVLLSPILVLTRLSGWACRGLRLRRPAEWFGRRRILLRTDVSARVERAILGELLEVALPLDAHTREPEALSLAILQAPWFHEMITGRGGEAEAKAYADRIARAIGEYTGTRSAIAEFTTALLTLIVGGLVFQVLTPGMISMVPGIAEAVSRSSAVAGFPLGETLGGIWYGIFPASPGPWLVAATIIGLVLLGSVITAFAGVVADPVQTRLGIHRRRLLRLLDTLDAEMTGARDRPFVTREHYVVRLFDLWDAALSLLRAFRS